MSIRHKEYSICDPVVWERTDGSGFTIHNIDYLQEIGGATVVRCL
jgi:hypothetical protein